MQCGTPKPTSSLQHLRLSMIPGFGSPRECSEGLEELIGNKRSRDCPQRSRVIHHSPTEKTAAQPCRKTNRSSDHPDSSRLSFRCLNYALIYPRPVPEP